MIRILVLEDDPDMREHLAMVLEDEGYEVTAVASGAEAVDRAREQDFDLVVADIRMKGLSGLDALEKMRVRQPDIHSLVVTGYSTEADSIRAIRLGVGEYLKKPFHLDDFLEAVRRLVARRQEEQQARQREQALRRTALTALEALSRSLDSAGLLGASRLGSRLAASVGLSAEAAESVQLATLVSGLERTHPEVQAGLLIEALSPGVRRLFQEVRELWDGTGQGEEPTLEASVATVAQVAAELDASSGPLSGQIAELQPGRFPDALLQALDRAHAEAGPAASHPRAPDGGRRRRGLLSLARALEGSGDGESAFRAFDDVVREGEQTREGAEALLGMARLARAGGDAPGARELAWRAHRHGARLGPVAAAEIALDASLLLGQLGVPEAAPPLSAAARTLDDLHRPAAAARARVGLACLYGEGSPEEGLALLLQPEHRDELAQCAGWLLPALLERPEPGPAEGRALRRLSREFPAELDRLLERGGLSAGARRAAARALAQGAAGARVRAVLQRLAADSDPAVRQEALQALQAAEPAEAGPPLLRIHSLGAFEVYRGEDRVSEGEWQSRNVRHLLAFLAQASRPVPVEQLLEQFWPEHPDTGRKNLNWAASILRKALRPPDYEGPAEYVLRTGQSLQLNPDLPHWHDLSELNRELETARKEETGGRLVPALEHARRAVQLYRGPYLEECYLDWALDIRNQTEIRVLEASRRLAGLAMQQGSSLEVLEYARRVLELDPCDQDAWLLLMQANLALGRAEEAVRQYEVGSRVLRQELGVEPTIDMMREHQRALIALSTPPGA